MAQELSVRQSEIRAALGNTRRQIASLLENEDRAKKFLAAGLVVANSAALSKCSPDSIAQAMVGIAMSDLNIDPNIGHCYLVPYSQKGASGSWETIAQLQVGYKGFIQLMYRAGWSVKAFSVFKCDSFEMEFNGWDNTVKFSPSIDAREEGDNDWVFDNMRGVYVVSRCLETKEQHSMFVSKQVIEKLRLNSNGQKISNYMKDSDKKLLSEGRPIGTWATWYEEMAFAKAIKRLAKKLPIGDSRVAIAIAADDKAEMGVIVDYSRTAETGVTTEASDSVINSTSTKEVEVGKEGGSEVKTRVTLESVIRLVEVAETDEDFNAVATAAAALTDSEKKALRPSWTARKATLEAMAGVAESAKQEAPKQATAEAPNEETLTHEQWIRKAGACKSKAEFMSLIAKIPEDVKAEISDDLDLIVDMLR